MHMRLLSYLMEICLFRSCYAVDPDDGCPLPRSEQQPEGERKIRLFSYFLILILLAIGVYYARSTRDRYGSVHQGHITVWFLV